MRRHETTRRVLIDHNLSTANLHHGLFLNMFNILHFKDYSVREMCLTYGRNDDFI